MKTNIMMGSLMSGAALLALGTLISCADPARSGRAQGTPPDASASSAARADGKDPYPGVNPVAEDRDVWQQLLSDHAAIRRTLVHREQNGVGIVEATTESDDPAVAARIIDHALAMQARMKVGAQVRVWDPVFAELFKKHGAVTIEVTPTDKGVTIIERSADPEAVALLRAHAMGVSEFVREGHAAGQRRTRRFNAGDPLPPPELAIGGVPHRFLLMQPDAGQLAGLKAGGVDIVINFRKPAEHPEYNERAAAEGAGMTYCNMPYAGAAEITDELLDSVRAAIKAADEKGDTATLHCRTGNRIGPGWASYRVLDKGVPIEQAIGEAKAMRMLDPLMESETRDYIRRHAAAATVPGRVQWIGGMHKAVHDGDRGGKVAVSSLLRTPHLNALGPVAGLRGEITVIDGEASVSVVDEKGPTTASADVEAAFLAWAYVPEWTRVAIPPSVRTQEQLEVFVLEAAKEAGLPADQPLVFRVEGRARSLKMHVIWQVPGGALGKEAHDKAKVPVAVKDEDISIIGFWSTQHLGVFTPMVSPFHMHAWTSGKRISGHVDDVQMLPGGTLLLPSRSAASTGDT
jgi:acetolactate decarboxylase